MNIEDGVKKIIARSDSEIWKDKINEFDEGLEAVKEQYDDKFTKAARDEAITEYKQNKLKEIHEELEEYDDGSGNLINNILEKIDKEMTEDEMNLHPQTELDFKKYDYYINEVKNELATSFIGGNTSTKVFDRVIERAYTNHLYALAVLSNRQEIFNRLHENDVVNEDDKANVRAIVGHSFDNLKDHIMPERYKKNKEYKEQINLYKMAARNKAMMFEIIKDNPNTKASKDGKSWDNLAMLL